MVDPVGAGAAALGTGLSYFTALLDQAKATRNERFVSLVGEAQEAFIRLRNENAQLQDQVRELSRELERIRELGELVPTRGGYWKRVTPTSRAPDGWDGPFCMRCADCDQKRVRLRTERSSSGQDYTACYECRRTYGAAVPPSEP